MFDKISRDNSSWRKLKGELALGTKEETFVPRNMCGNFISTEVGVATMIVGV